MKAVKDIHSTLSSILGVTLLGVLWPIANSKWWSCSTGGSTELQLWTMGSIALTMGTCLALVARHYNYAEQLKYWTEVAVRMLFIYALITIALIKTEGQFYDLSLMTKEQKLSQLASSTFASAFYGYSPLFQAYSGAILLTGLVLLAFRNTLRLGTLILAAALVNTVMLDVSFDSCFVMKNSIFLSAATYLLFTDVFSSMAFITRSEPLVRYDWTPLPTNSHLYKSAYIYKVVLLVGLIAYNHEFVQNIKDYRGRNKNNPIAGVWQVESIDYLKSKVSEQTKADLADIDKIIIDKDRFGAVAVGDSLSYFEFIVNPQDRQLEFWNFYDFRDMDLKGRYEQIAPDTLLYVGRNNKDSLQIVLTLEHPPEKSN